MKNIIWEAKLKTPKSYNELKQSLLDDRNLNESEINDFNFKKVFKDPKIVNFEITDLKKSAELITDLLKNNKGIIIHGDYDVDGITSSAIAYEGLLEIGFTKDLVSVFMPNRFNHGYGFSQKSYAEIKQKTPVKEYPLIILLDCGISSHTVIKQAQKDGYKIIVVDHHQIKKNKPKAEAVFWNDKLTASVLTYFFIKFMQLKIKGSVDLESGVDLAGLGYVCDLGDLSNVVGRAITIKSLNSSTISPRPGLQSIIKSSGKKVTKLSSFDYGWLIGPRLNASGRMLDPEISFELLTTTEQPTADSLALDLNSINTDRQDSTKTMYEEALSGISNGKFMGLSEEDLVIVPHSQNFHEGVIGLISSRLVQNFFKPSLTIAWEGEEGKGSCRSVPGVDITKILASVSEYLENWGGHPQAAGFSIKKENFENFINVLKEKTKELISKDLLVPKIIYDCRVQSEFLSNDFLNFLDFLEPYGNGNNKPVFRLSNAMLDDFKLLGNSGDHISFTLKDTGMRSIFFGGAKYLPSLTNSETYDLLFNFDKNEWNGNVYPQLVIKEIKPSEF